MKAINFSQYKQIQKMSLNEMDRFLTTVYQSGFDDCKKAIGADGDDVYVWDADKVRNVLIQNYISPRLADKIVEDLTR